MIVSINAVFAASLDFDSLDNNNYSSGTYGSGPYRYTWSRSGDKPTYRHDKFNESTQGSKHGLRLEGQGSFTITFLSAVPYLKLAVPEFEEYGSAYERITLTVTTDSGQVLNLNQSKYLTHLGSSVENYAYNSWRAKSGSPTSDEQDLYGMVSFDLSSELIKKVKVDFNTNQASLRFVEPSWPDNLDFGDAPSSYGLASHLVPSFVSRYLGNNKPDSETSPSLGTNASGDGSDEDGAKIGSSSLQNQTLYKGQSSTISVKTNGFQRLSAWIDWNRDGDFNDSGEKIASNQTGSTINLNVTPPSNASVGTSYARFRYSSTSNLAPTGYAGDGEVEDYKITIQNVVTTYDFGDAPSSYGVARHTTSSGGSNYYLGNTKPDSESSSQHGSNASGDGSDEDGITTSGSTLQNKSFTQGQIISLSAKTSNNGRLSAWIDWNRDGDFNDSGEKVATDRTGSTINFNVHIPTNASTGTTYARFRYGTATGLGSTGNTGNGEVEDYKITINTPSTYVCPSNSGNGGYAASGIGTHKDKIFWLTWDCSGQTFQPGTYYKKSWNLINNTVVTAEIRNIRNASVKTYNSGSWSGDTFDDAYSGVNPVGLTNASNGQTPKFDVHWSMTIDGTSRPVDLVVSDVEDTASSERISGTTNGAPWEIFEVVSNPNASDVAFNAVFSNGGKTLELQGTRNYYAGAVIGFSKGISVLNMDIKQAGIQGVGFGVVLPFDRGDAPASYGDPTHYIPKVASGTSQSSGTFTAAQVNAAVPNITDEYDYYLGSQPPTAERIAIHSTNADTDNAQDDGVLFGANSFQDASLAAGTTSTLTINTHGNGVLNAWFDWNNDGDFNDTGEQVATNVSPSSNQIKLSVNVPTTAIVGSTYARFRFSSQTNLTPINHATNGEIEDYKFTVLAALPKYSCTAPKLYQFTTSSGYETTFNIALKGFQSSHSTPLGFHINAVGYREQDQYVYGLNLSSTPRSIVRVGSDGNYQTVGDLDAAFTSIHPNAGDVHPDGTLWVTNNNVSNLYQFDVTTSPPTLLNTYNNALPVRSTDLAFSADGNRLYIMGNGGNKLYEVDMTTNPPTPNTTPIAIIEAVPDPSTASWGAQWATPTKFYAYNNKTGNLFVIDLATKASELLIAAGTKNYNDGTSCRTEIDFSDFSDAPTTSYGSAEHTVKAGVKLGSSISIEHASYNSPNADGDTDDGMTIPTIPGVTGTASAIVSGSGGYLQGWVDWNNDGDFSDTGEQVASNLVDGNDDDIITFSVTPPISAANTQVFARFRWSTTQNLDSTTKASDGEVEDYKISISAPVQDHSDAPASYGDAAHNISGDLRLGLAPSYETAALSNVNADGDSDDGVSNPLFIAGKSTNIPVTVSGSGGYLQAWVDWNQDGDFADLGEQVATDLQDTDNDGFINVYATAPAGASTGDSYARFRWSSQSGLDATAAASDGEVEDYKIKVASAPAGFSGSCSSDGNIWYNSPTKLYTYNIFSKQETLKTNLSKVYGDIALGRNGKLYGVTFGGTKALDEIDPNTGATTTLFTDLPLSGNNALSVDEFGWLYIGMSTGTKVYRYLPGVSTGLELWIDVSKYGESGNSSGDFIMIDGAAYIAWSKIVTVTTSNSVSTSFSSQLLRVSNLGSNNEVTPSSTVTSLGNMPNSFYGLTGNVAGKLYGVSSTKGLYEVARSPFGTTKIADLTEIPYGATSVTEAYGTVCQSYDYSDAPSSYGSPYHSISNDLHLGKTAPSPENATQPSTAADADGAEEDGARFATSLIKGAKAVLHIDVTKPSGASPKIDAWVDWNKDGSFSSSEKIIDNDTLTSTTVDKAYTLDVPSDAVAGDTYLRVRLSTAGGLSPDGAANDGEVEDFLVTVINGGTINGQVWLDNNEDGANNAGDTGIQNATVKLYQKSSNRFLKAVQADANGNYSFTQLPADTYYLEFVALPSHTLVAKGADSKADASTARTDDITLAAGNTQANWNAGYTTSASVISHCSVAPAYNSAAFTHNFSLPKFDSISGILLGVRIDTYPVMRQVWGVENKDAAVASYQISYSSSSPAQFTLPNGNQVDHNYNHDLGTLAPAAFDNVIDFTGTSGQGSATWSYETATQQTTYTPITDFQSASAGEQITIPYTAWNHQATTQFNGGTPSYVNVAESSANICVIYTYASKDYGDAPDSYGVASHSVANGQLFLGTHAPDTESKSLNTSNGGADGTGDDSNGTDDEDGSSFVPLSTSDSAYTTTVTVTNTTGKDATLVGWVDFNNNDSFEAIEAVSTTVADGTTNSTVTLKWDFLNESGGASTAAGATFARLRLSTDAALDTSFHAGDLSDGEVEDYALTITAPPEKAAMACSGAWAQEGSNYTTTLSNGIKITASTTIATGGSWKYSPNGNLNTHDAFSDADLKGNTSFQFVYNWDATREGSSNAADDGVNGTMTFSFDRPVFNPILHIDRVGGVGNGVSNSALITLTTPNTSMSKLSGFSHLTVTSNAIQRTIGVPSNGAESNSDPAQGTAAGSIAIQGEKLNSLDFTLSPLGVEGAGGDGIEMVLCIDNNYDYGDAPASYGRPHHYYPAADSPYLGAQKADVETDTLNGSNGGTDGLGDDQGNLDDEDGISTLAPLNASASRYSTQVVVNNPLNEMAYLLAWIDFDGNGTFDNDELKTVTIAAHEDNANVTVVWDKLPNDIQAGNSYLRLRLTSDSDVFNAKSATAVAADGEVEDYALTIENTTFSVAGRLFTDSNVDGVYDNGERGMQKILVALTGTDTQGNAVCIGTLSKADGRYQFVNIPTGNYTVYETTDTSGTCNVASANAPAGFISTTPMSQAITVSNANITDVNFGQVYDLVIGSDGSNIAFHKDEQSQIVAGEVVTYAHTFKAPAKGTVNFVQNLQGNNWGSLLHHDANCDRKLSSAERNTTLSTINVNANDQVCLVATVGSPISAQTGEQSKLQITANFTYAGTLSAQTRSLSVTDITTVKQGTEEQGAPLSNFDHRRLELIKTVQNITAGTPATETLNQAQPDDILEYRIHYYNQTAKDIDHLNVNDMVPDYTSLVGGSAGCDNTPTGLSCNAQINGDAIQWNFSGVLKSGHRGSVRYRVTVD